LHFEARPGASKDLRRRWEELGIDVPLLVVRYDGDVAGSLAGFVASLPDDVDVNVILASPAHAPLLDRLRRRRFETQLTHALLPHENARITLVRDHPGAGHAVTAPENGETRLRIVPRLRHRVVVPIDRADRAALRAVRYALSLGAADVRAVHAAVDQQQQEALIARWMELGVPVELDVVECWDRNVARSLEHYVVEMMGRGNEITVVMPRRDYAHLRYRLLHDRSSRRIAKALGRYEHVDLAVVPFFFGRHDRPATRSGVD
jgi:uncharacterized protein YehS (DUF1456 family)